MPDTSTVSVRDFIYLDFDFVLSLYSQLEGGFTSRIVRQRVQQIFSGESSQGSTSINTVGGTSDSRAETRVLHDHAYHTA